MTERATPVIRVRLIRTMPVSIGADSIRGDAVPVTWSGLSTRAFRPTFPAVETPEIGQVLTSGNLESVGLLEQHRKMSTD